MIENYYSAPNQGHMKEWAEVLAGTDAHYRAEAETTFGLPWSLRFHACQNEHFYFFSLWSFLARAETGTATGGGKARTSFTWRF